MYKLEAPLTRACLSMCFVPPYVKGHKFNCFQSQENVELLKDILRAGLKLSLITTACLSQYPTVTELPMQTEEVNLRNKNDKILHFHQKSFYFELLIRQ